MIRTSSGECHTRKRIRVRTSTIASTPTSTSDSLSEGLFDKRSCDGYWKGLRLLSNAEPIKRYRATSNTASRPKIVPARQARAEAGVSGTGRRHGSLGSESRPPIDRTTARCRRLSITSPDVSHRSQHCRRLASTDHHRQISLTQNSYFSLGHTTCHGPTELNACLSIVSTIGFSRRGPKKVS